MCFMRKTLGGMLMLCTLTLSAQELKINDLEYFEADGVNVLVYSNLYNGIFCDEKKAGVEIIQRAERIATGGCVRMMNTPEQWDIYPEVSGHEVDRANNTISSKLYYPDYDFTSVISVKPSGKGFVMSVSLDKPVPEKLVGKAGLNFEFFPASYFGKTFMMDGKVGILPRAAAGEVVMLPLAEKITQMFNQSTFDDRGRNEFMVAQPFASGKTFVIAPEDESLRVLIKSDAGLNVYDGRNLAQNAMFVVRTLLPADKTGVVLEWYVEPTYDSKWIREPNIGISQIGYTPAQKKVAVMELDKNDPLATTANVVKINEDGSTIVALAAEVKQWGVFNYRYNYATVDFSSVKETGLYYIDYKGTQSGVFPIEANVYEGKWHTTMDVWLPVQMDHMEVNEGYRIWHGRAHMDDALQAPVNYEQHDGYSQGAETRTKYKPWEHIPGLAVGGWFDAGDFDIQGATIHGMVSGLAELWETFRPERDQTYIDQQTQFVDIHRPDGTPDVIQQVEHGALNIIAQVENIGFVAQGIVQSNMHQYHHLGNAVSITDGKVYDASLKPYEVKGEFSGTRDDRVAFTGNFLPVSTMPTVAALAATARVVKEYKPETADKALKTALMLWDKYYQQSQPQSYVNNNFTAHAVYGNPRLDAALQLWLTTGDKKYCEYFVEDIFKEINPEKLVRSERFITALQLYPKMDKKFQKRVAALVPKYVEQVTEQTKKNPYGVPFTMGGWGGNGGVISWAYSNYMVWKLFPTQIDPELVLSGLNYLYGCHPQTNVSFVNSVGVNTKKVAYGSNRADYTVIPGGIVPGLIGIAPDFLENKDDYPFLWGENECCTNTVPSYVMLSIACQEVAAAINK